MDDLKAPEACHTFSLISKKESCDEGRGWILQTLLQTLKWSELGS